MSFWRLVTWIGKGIMYSQNQHFRGPALVRSALTHRGLRKGCMISSQTDTAGGIMYYLSRAPYEEAEPSIHYLVGKGENGAETKIQPAGSDGAPATFAVLGSLLQKLGKMFLAVRDTYYNSRILPTSRHVSAQTRARPPLQVTSWFSFARSSGERAWQPKDAFFFFWR